MKYRLRKNRIVPFAAILLALGVLCGCESRIVNQQFESTSLTVRINTAGASPKLLAQVDQFQVTVVELISNRVIAEQPLTLNGQFIEGQIDSLPSGIDLEFTARAMRLTDGIIIYEGVTVIMLSAGAVTVVPISMSPVVPVMKSTPRYDNISVVDSSSHFIDVKIFNVNQLFGTSFRVFYDPNFLLFDSVTLSATINPNDVIFFAATGFDATSGQPFVAISVTNTTAGVEIVDLNGDVNLARVFYSLEFPASTPNSSILRLEPTGLTDITGNQIDPAILFVDETIVEITP